MLPTIIYILVVCFVVAVGLLGAWLQIRRMRIRPVVQTLASIVAQNLPLPAALRAAARSERGSLARIYTRLATRLDVGDSLSAALRSTLLTCPGEMIGAVQGAERGGTLPSVLQTLAAEARRTGGRPTSGQHTLWYFLVLAVVAPAVVTFVMVVVVPKLHEIFLDFGAPLPAVTLSLVDLARAGAERWYLLLAIAGAALLALVQMAIGRFFIVRVAGRAQALYLLWDTLVWCLPFARQVVRSRALARQLPLLAAGVRAGHDLPAAARQATCIPVNWHARRRLACWAEALEQGADPLAAARRIGFPAPVLRVLTAAQQGTDLVAGLDYLVAYYQALWHHWERVALSGLGPLLVLFWAAFVLYITTALLLPLQALLDSVMDTIY